MNRPLIDSEAVHTALLPIPKQTYENEYNRLVKDTSPLDEPFEDMPEEKGDGISTFRQYHYRTSHRLIGSAMKLNSQSLVRYQDFKMPEDVTAENCEALLYKRKLATVSFTLLYVTEPGIMTRVSSMHAIMFFRNYAELEYAGPVGLAHVLNGTAADNDTYEATLGAFHASQRHIEDIRADEQAHIDELLNGLELPPFKG